jgi:formylglycine-generating enzyme required for sulfatase activity
MVIVPRSCLQVGCDPARQGCLPSDPAPRLVELGPFQVDKTEVTRSDLARCIEDGACPRTQQPAELRQQGPLPAGKVTFAEAQAFCKFAGKRLPTADEWELAARGPDGRLYPWGNDVSNCSRARTRECGGGDARDVGTLPAGASPYGALDMAGNVAEIVSPTACELANRPATLQIARRGGSYLDEVPATRATSLAYAAESAASSGVGFRCVKDAIPPDAGL